jgi:mRNA interferase HigB
MRVISNKRLVDSGALHPHATVPLKVWRRCIEANAFEHFANLKAVFGSVDRVGGLYVFDIGGNKHRLVAAFHFDRQIAYIRHVFTHAEYDRWSPP